MVVVRNPSSVQQPGPGRPKKKAVSCNVLSAPVLSVCEYQENIQDGSSDKRKHKYNPLEPSHYSDSLAEELN